MTPAPLLLLGTLACAHRSVAPLPAVAAPAAPSTSLPASGTVEPALSSASGAPTAPTLVPGNHAHNRRVSIDFLVRALIWDITQNYRIDPEQYGSRPDLLYIPVATYSVQKDATGKYVAGNDCVELLAQQLSDALASPTDFPPFLYQAVPEHPPLPTRLQPAELGSWERVHDDLIHRKGVRVAADAYQESPPSVLLTIEEGLAGQLRVTQRIIPLDPAEGVDPEGRTVLVYRNLDQAPVYKASLAGGLGFQPALADICPDAPPRAQEASTQPAVPRTKDLHLDYQAVRGGQSRTVTPGQVTCIGDRIVPTVFSPQEGYVYLVQHSSDGACRTVFPHAGQDHYVRAGGTLEIRYPNGEPIRVDGPPGVDRIWVHLSDRADLDTTALLSQKSDGACDRVAVREALGQQSARYRTWATAEEAGATLPVVVGTGLTEEALFPVEDCD